MSEPSGPPRAERLCPFAGGANRVRWHCSGVKCALFDDEHEACALLVAAVRLAVPVHVHKPRVVEHYDAGPKRSWWAQLWKRGGAE